MDKNLLEGFTIFADADADALEAIAAHCRVTEYRAGDQVFAQDAAAEGVYGVVEGGVELVLMFTEQVLSHTIEYEEALSVSHEVLEKPVVVETLGPGDVFGWSSMVVPPGHWTASARCTAPAKVFEVPAAALQSLFEERPAVGYRFMRRLGGVIAQRLQHRTAKLVDAWGEAFDGGMI